MASVMEENSWAKGLDFITEFVVQQLVEDQKIVTINSNFSNEDLASRFRDLCDRVVVPFAERRESIINDKLKRAEALGRDAEAQLSILRDDIQKVEEQSKREREEFVATEESYTRELADLNADHQAALVKCDEDLISRDNEIGDLKGQINDLKKELREKDKSVEREEYIKRLENDYVQLKETNDELEERVGKITTTLAEREADVVNERQDVNKFMAQVGQKNKDLGEARGIIRQLQTRVTKLEKEKEETEKATQTLTAAMAERQATIEGLKRDIEEYTKRSTSSRGKSSKSSKQSSEQGGTLDYELELAESKDIIDELTGENNALQAQADQYEKELAGAQQRIEVLEKEAKSSKAARNKLDNRVRELENQAKEKVDGSQGEIEKLKKTIDELHVSLRRVRAESAERAKEIARLEAIEAKFKELQRQERESQSLLNVRIQELKRVEEELQQLKQSGGTAKQEDVAKCEEENAELKEQVEKIRAELQSLQKDYDDLLGKAPTPDEELKRLRELLRKANRDLEDAVAEHNLVQETLDRRIAELTADKDLAESRVKQLTDEFNALLEKSQEGGGNIVVGYEELSDNVQKHTQEVRDSISEQIRENETMKQQYLERLRKMKEEARTGTAQGNATKKRAAGVQREVDRMSNLIRTLQSEEGWFMDTLDQLRDARERTSEAAAAAFADAEAIRLRLAEVLAARGDGGGPAQPPVNAASVDQIAFNRFLILTNFLAFLVFVGMGLGTGREYGVIRWANQPVRRAHFLNTLEKVALWFRMPSYELLWELLAIILVGGTAKWSTL